MGGRSITQKQRDRGGDFGFCEMMSRCFTPLCYVQHDKGNGVSVLMENRWRFGGIGISGVGYTACIHQIVYLAT